MAETTFTTEGTLFDKNTRTVQGKKDPTQSYTFSSFKLEMVSNQGGKTYTEIPEFHCGKGVNIDDFEIGDYVSVRFVLKGKKISDTWYKTEANAIFVKRAELEGSKDNKATRGGVYTPNTNWVPPVPESGEQEKETDMPF